eukprot:scaffold142793_cov124-Phaeocystis_antarctica.AAC.1
MFWDGVRLRGGENGTGLDLNTGRCAPVCGMLWVPAKGGRTDTTTCTAPFGLRPTDRAQTRRGLSARARGFCEI